jgi:hypothetical protein
MSAPSKNQRSGPRVKSRIHYCPAGHPLVRVLLAPGGKGRNRFIWQCNTAEDKGGLRLKELCS